MIESRCLIEDSKGLTAAEDLVLESHGLKEDSAVAAAELDQVCWRCLPLVPLLAFCFETVAPAAALMPCKLCHLFEDLCHHDNGNWPKHL
jgi:hypothetical protein